MVNGGIMQGIVLARNETVNAGNMATVWCREINNYSFLS